MFPLLTVTTHVFESGFEFRSNAAVLFLHTVCETNEVCEQVDAGLIHVQVNVTLRNNCIPDRAAWAMFSVI